MERIKELGIKTLLSIIITSILYVIVYFFLLHYDTYQTTINWFLDHRFYTIFLYVSIVIILTVKQYPTFNLQNRVYKFLLVVHFVLLASFFVVGNLSGSMGISLYSQKPDIAGFVQQSKVKLYFKQGQSQITHKLIIKTEQGKEEYNLNTIEDTQNITLGKHPVLTFASQKKDLSQVILVMKNGDIVSLQPQSSIQIDILGDEYIYKNRQGTTKVWKFLDESIPSDIIDYQKEYILNLKKYLRQQIGISDKKSLNRLNKMLLDVLFTISPKSFATNVLNYHEFKQYFDLFEEQKDITQTQVTNTNIINTLKDSLQHTQLLNR